MALSARLAASSPQSTITNHLPLTFKVGDSIDLAFSRVTWTDSETLTYCFLEDLDKADAAKRKRRILSISEDEGMRRIVTEL
jgi:hypothetical protein